MEHAGFLPSEVAVQAGDLLHALGQAGWTTYGGRYDAETMGELVCRSPPLRSNDAARKGQVAQYMVTDVPPEPLKAAGLWKAFDNWQEFRAAVLKWATAL